MRWVNKLTVFAFFGAGFVLSGCSNKETPPHQKTESANPKEPAPLYYYDLGSARADVSAYPKHHRETYRLFLVVCGACHTTARPLNAPYAKKTEWKRFVNQMHVKMAARGINLNPSDEKRIVDLLVYDSKIRKIQDRDKFQQAQEELKRRFVTSCQVLTLDI